MLRDTTPPVTAPDALIEAAVIVPVNVGEADIAKLPEPVTVPQDIDVELPPPDNKGAPDEPAVAGKLKLYAVVPPRF